MVKEIKLTQGKFALVDDEDYDELNKHKWCAWKNSDGTFYAVRRTKDKNRKIGIARMHREILNAPKDKHVDHRNHDGLDNRKCNIRICTRSENLRNCKIHKTNTSGLMGVSLDYNTNRWRADISKNNKQIFLGCFDDKDEAGRAYDMKAIELSGEFAILNFPEEKK
jgi:hypothetical protein